MPRVVFQPSARTVDVPAGVTYLEAARLASALLEAPCGGRGVCGKCRVQVSPAPPPTAGEARLLSPEEIDSGVRLACLCRVLGDSTCLVPSLPPGQKPGSRCDRGLPAPDPIVPAGPGCVGVALDLGTTTLAGAAADLGNGQVVAVAFDTNPCLAFGADVMSRIQASVGGQKEALTACLREGVAALLDRLLGERPSGSLRLLTVVGNSAVLAMLLGADLSGLAALPFEPPLRGGTTVPGEALGLPGGVTVAVLPVIGGFVGADATAVALACGLDGSGEPVLAVDVGTNGELLLAARGRLLAASCAAGPALEGAGISCGMRAVPGAVAGVRVRDGGLEVEVIGGGAPKGLCGSGLVDLAAALLDLGLLEESGFLQGGRFTLDGITVTQRDLRELQLAKGAMRAGAEVLLREAGLEAWDAVERLLLAGTFGSFLGVSAARRIGLIPPVREDAVHRVGNAALEGALRALLSREEWERARALAARVEHVELGARADFQERFAEAMRFAPV